MKSRSRSRILLAVAVAAGLGPLGLFLWARLASEPARVGAALDELKSLPYARWAGAGDAGGAAGEHAGVVRHDPERAYPGVNLLPFEHRPGARLLGMDGEVVLELVDRRAKPTVWKLVEPLAEDRFLVLALGLFEIDRRSEIRWQVDTDYHHDVATDAAGRIYALDRRRAYRPRLNALKPIVDDYLVVLDSEGRVEREISFADVVERDPDLVAAVKEHERAFFDLAHDVFHANTVEVIPEDVQLRGQTVFRAGQVLVCWRNLDLVAALDPETGALAWRWGGGELDAPHQPTLLANGNLLIFDNGRKRGWSRVVELDPLAREIVWEYRADPPEAFYTPSRGSAQRLPNGNTLITESDEGRVFEVAPEGDVVWEFFHPELRRRGLLRRLERPTIYRMTRLGPDFRMVAG